MPIGISRLSPAVGVALAAGVPVGLLLAAHGLPELAEFPAGGALQPEPSRRPPIRGALAACPALRFPTRFEVTGMGTEDFIRMVELAGASARDRAVRDCQGTS